MNDLLHVEEHVLLCALSRLVGLAGRLVNGKVGSPAGKSVRRSAETSPVVTDIAWARTE